MYEPTAKDYAAIYARVSNPTKDTSIESQIEIGKQILEKKNLLLYDIYSDKETATKFEPIHRKGFNRLIYDAMNNKFKTLIVFRRDRLARKQKDFNAIRDMLRKYNVSIIYSNKGEFQPFDSFVSDFIENMFSAIDEMEPKTIQARSYNGINIKRQHGEYSCGYCCPFGYKKLRVKKVKGSKSKTSNNEKEYSPDQVTAPIVKMIFAKFMNIDNENYTKTHLLNEINEVSYSKKISNVDLNYMIKNPVYAGLYLPDSKDSVLKYVYKDDFGNFQVDKTQFKNWENVDPILDKDCWYEALKHYCLITKHKTKIKEDTKDYLFKNLLTCKKCNKKLYLTGNKYRCSKGCTNIRYGILVDILLEKIFHDILKKNLKNYYEKKLKDIEIHISQLDKNLKINKLKQRDTLIEMIKKENFDEKSINEFNVKENKLLDEVNILKEKASILVKVSETFNYILCLSKISELQSYLKRNSSISQIFLSSIVEVITINDKSTKYNIEKIKYVR